MGMSKAVDIDEATLPAKTRKKFQEELELGYVVAEVKDTFGAIVRMFMPSHTGRITSSNVDGLITEVRASKEVQYPLVRKILEKAGSDWQKRKKLSSARAIRRLRKKARTDHEKAIVHFF
eukprot:g15680.t1